MALKLIKLRFYRESFTEKYTVCNVGIFQKPYRKKFSKTIVLCINKLLYHLKNVSLFSDYIYKYCY